MHLPLHLNGLSEEEFSRVNERALIRLREIHPDRSDEELAHPLRQAMGLTEASGYLRLVETASLMLGRD